MSNIIVFLPCSGVGRIRRGYESFTQECFEAFRGSPGLDVRLFKGGGRVSENESVLWSFPRSSAMARWLGRLLRRDAYFAEQFTFFLSLRRHLLVARPEVVYFSDGNLGNLLWRWRRKHGLRYRLLFSNGGPLSPPFPRWDLVHQVSSVYFDEAKCAGQSDGRQVLLPYGFAIPENVAFFESTAKAALRLRLGLPIKRKILLSVGAVNSSNKRMDYIVSELAKLPAPRPYLLILGQSDKETPSIAAIAAKSLGVDNVQIRSVPHSEIGGYYAASDLFVLASLREGLGRVLVEALSHGLLCLAHDYPVAREVLAADGRFTDFRQSGALGKMLGPALADSGNEAARLARHSHAYQRFSWNRLRDRYTDMIHHCAASDIAAPT